MTRIDCYREGLAVVKVFAIHDPSLPLKAHKDQVEDIKKKLNNSSNCLPFLRSTVSFFSFETGNQNKEEKPRNLKEGIPV